MKPLTPEQEIWRAQKARQFLDDPMIKEALDGIQRRIIEQWSDAPIKDSEIREKAWMMYNMHKLFVECLREHIATGEMASLQLKQPRKFGIF